MGAEQRWYVKLDRGFLSNDNAGMVEEKDETDVKDKKGDEGSQEDRF